MASHRYTLASPALALQTINHAEQCSVLAREVQYRPGMFDCTGRWHCAYVPAPTNARYWHTAVGVQQFPPGVSNNSLRIHCAVKTLAKTPLYESRSQNLCCATCNLWLCCAVFP